MGKGKRIKSERKFKKQLDAVFKSANEQSRLPHYSQASFLKEYEESGFKFDVFRKWTYLKARKDPKTIDSAIESGILKTLKNMNIKVKDDGTMVQL